MKIENTTVLSAFLGSFLGVAVFALLAWAPMRSHHRNSMMGGNTMMDNHHGQAMNADQRFLAMMVPHHEGAVAMADLALQKAEHPELKELARAIKETQTEEIADMQKWHKDWYGKDLDASASEGMMPGMGHMSSMMSGDLDALRNAKPFDREFIRQMIPHHEMAVMMARMIENSSREEMRTLAANIIRSQTAEIETMRAWEASWYGAK